jgi:lipoprotein-anchoring transpeptidase ErfK/SrfK
MSSRTRVSRGLVATVGIVIAVGAVAYLKKNNKTVANDKGGSPVALVTPTPTAVIPSGVKPAEPAPNRTGQIALPGSANALITQTPGVGPTKTNPPVSAPANNPAPPAKPPASDIKVAATDNKAAAPAKLPVDERPAGPTSATPIADGKAQIDLGNLLAGRKILNDSLSAGRLSAADADKAKELMAVANETLIFSPRRNAEDPFTGSHTVQPGEKLAKIAVTSGVTWDFLGRINGIADARRIRAGQTIKTVKGPFHAVVSKTKFTMDLYLGSPGERGSMYVRSFPVGLGKHGSTPTGTWMVQPQSKLKNPKWWGTPDEPAREAGDPLNPLGKFWLGLVGTDGDAVGKEGFGIHGTIDPASIGKEMSHGCIRLVNENVERVYEMLVDGRSTIIVRE